jgi:hypothetical protein
MYLINRSDLSLMNTVETCLLPAGARRVRDSGVVRGNNRINRKVSQKSQDPKGGGSLPYLGDLVRSEFRLIVVGRR